MAIYLTSDLHLGHNKDFIYKSRGFESIQEHDEIIVKRWNDTITEEDTVYVLGDLIMGDIPQGYKYLSQLKGRKFFTIGNHDGTTKLPVYRDAEITNLGYAMPLKYRKYHFYLTHYPTITSNFDGGLPLKKQIINLFGHTHQKENFYNDNPLMYHVGVDSHDCRPVSIDQIIAEIEEKAQGF